MQAIADSWDFWQRHLVVVPIIVLAMVFVIIPRMQRLLQADGGCAAESRCGS